MTATVVVIGNAAARSISFANRDRSVYYYPDRQWFAPFAGPYDCIENGALNSDKRVAPIPANNFWAFTVYDGYLVFLRLYGPLESWFDKTWKPGDFEKLD